MLRTLLTAATLFSFAGCATTLQIDTDTDAGPNVVISEAAGEAFKSQYDFATTDARLKAALDKRALKIFAVVDHGNGARSVGTSIGNSKLYIFGNPKSGTPLMAANRLMGLELPMKMLVYEDADGAVRVAHKNIETTLEAYGITGTEATALKIAATMGEIVGEATGPYANP